MLRSRLGALAALALVPALCLRAAVAEDPVTPAPEAVSPVKAALDAWGALPGVALKGKVENKNEEASAMMDMVKGMMGGGGTGKPFKGEFEAWSAADMRAVVTTTDLPGVAFSDDGKSKLNRLTYSGKDAPDISAFRRESLKLLNRTTLVKALGALTWTPKPAETGATVTTYEGKASTSLVPPDDSGAAPKGVLVEADLGADGSLQALRVTVVRADPMDAVRAMVQMSGQAGMAGMLPPALTEDKLPRTVYSFTPAGDQPPERVKRFVDEAKALGTK
jgi:hypothetical protein